MAPNNPQETTRSAFQQLYRNIQTGFVCESLRDVHDDVGSETERHRQSVKFHPIPQLIWKTRLSLKSWRSDTSVLFTLSAAERASEREREGERQRERAVLLRLHPSVHRPSVMEEREHAGGGGGYQPPVKRLRVEEEAGGEELEDGEEEDSAGEEAAESGATGSRSGSSGLKVGRSVSPERFSVRVVSSRA